MSTKFLLPLLLVCLVFVSSSQAQYSTIDETITALYGSISFTADKNPDYDTFRSLFKEGGRLISVKDTTSFVLSPSDYEENMSQQRESGKILSFTEEELHRKTEEYGNIVHVFSTYQTHLETPDGSSSARGINSIQMMKEDGLWKVTSIIWYEADEANPLPEKYLPSDNTN